MTTVSADPPGVALAALRAYLESARPGLVTGELSAQLVEGGRSNLTFYLRDGEHEWVLRRPPLGHVLATAHDMGREFRVLSALGSTAVPVPQTVLFCADSDIMGAPFYLMQKVDGVVYRTAAQTHPLGPQRARGLGFALIDVLADLHAIDPASVGLSDFGHPDGFLARQVRRWQTQLQASYSRELPGMQSLHDRLAQAIPPAGSAAIVHGDFRLDNVLVGVDDQIAAVLDWEMATLGDPRTDLGLLLVYWDGMAQLPSAVVATAVAPGTGFPTGTELAQHYADRRGIDLAGLGWYVAFGYFKIAVILEGIHYRHAAGQTVGRGFDQIGDVVPALVELGLAAVKEA